MTSTRDSDPGHKEQTRSESCVVLTSLFSLCIKKSINSTQGLFFNPDPQIKRKTWTPVTALWTTATAANIQGGRNVNLCCCGSYYNTAERTPRTLPPLTMSTVKQLVVPTIQVISLQSHITFFVFHTALHSFPHSPSFSPSHQRGFFLDFQNAAQVSVPRADLPEAVDEACS